MKQEPLILYCTYDIGPSKGAHSKAFALGKKVINEFGQRAEPFLNNAIDIYLRERKTEFNIADLSGDPHHLKPDYHVLAHGISTIISKLNTEYSLNDANDPALRTTVIEMFREGYKAAMRNNGHSKNY